MTRSDRWKNRAPRVLYLGSAPTLGDGAIGDGLLRRLGRAWPERSLRILTSTPRFYASLPSAAGAEVGAKLDLQPHRHPALAFTHRWWPPRERLANGRHGGR